MIVSEKNLIPYRDETSRLIGFKNLQNEVVVEAQFKEILEWNMPSWSLYYQELRIACSTPEGKTCVIQYRPKQKTDNTFMVKTHDGRLCIFKSVDGQDEAILIKEFREEDGYDCSNYKSTRDGYLIVPLRTNGSTVYEVYDRDLACVCGKDDPVIKCKLPDIDVFLDGIVVYYKASPYKSVIFNGHNIKVLKSCAVVEEDYIIVLANTSGKVSFVDYCTGKVLFDDYIPELKSAEDMVDKKDIPPDVDVMDFGKYYKAIHLEKNAYVYNVLDQKFTKLNCEASSVYPIKQDILKIKYSDDKGILYKASLEKYSDEYEELTLVEDRHEAIVKNNGKSYLLNLNTFDRDSEEYDDIRCECRNSDTYIYITSLDGKYGAISKFTNKVLLNNIYSSVRRGDVGKTEYNQLEYNDGKNIYIGVYNSILQKMVVPVKYSSVVGGIYNEYIEMAKREYVGNECKTYKCIYNVENDSCVPVLPLDIYQSIKSIGLNLLKISKDGMVGVFRLDTQEWVYELTPNFVGEFKVDRENNQLKVITGTETKVITL